MLTDRAQGRGGGIEGVVIWGWRNVRPDLWPGLFVFGAVFFALGRLLFLRFSKSQEKDKATTGAMNRAAK